MSFTVTFGWQPKRYNSTNMWFKKKFSCDVVLKEPCNIVHPVFIIDRNHVTQIIESKNEDSKAQPYKPNFAEINYCHCGEFLRRYWISNIIYTSNDLVEVHCDCDVLASFKEIIEFTKGYVQFCSDKEVSNNAIDDGRLQPEYPIYLNQFPLFSAGEEGEDLIWTDNVDEMTMIVTTTTLLGEVGVATSWAMSMENFDKLSKQINTWITNNTGGTWEQIQKWFTKTFGGMGSISDFINDVRLMPIKYSKYPGDAGNVSLANTYIPNTFGKQFKVSYCKLYQEESGLPHSGTIIPYDAYTGQGLDYKTKDQAYFLRGSKYTKYVIKHPNGTLDISNDSLCDPGSDLSIQVGFSLDFIKGDYFIEAWQKNTGEFLGKANGNISVPFNILSSGGQLEILSNILSNTLSIGSRGLNSILNAKINPTITTTSNINDIKYDSQTGYAKSDKSIKTTERVQPAQIDLGIFGEFFPGNHTIETKPNASSGSGLLNIGASFEHITEDVDIGVNPTYMFSLMGTHMAPAVCTSQDDYNAYAELHGYPVSKVLSIKDGDNQIIHLGNYVKFSNVSIKCSGPAGHSMLPEETAQVNRFLNSGFFYEDGEPEG